MTMQIDPVSLGVPLGAVVALVAAGLLLFTKRQRMASLVLMVGLLVAVGAWLLTRAPTSAIR
jgi:hypothetical protein